MSKKSMQEYARGWKSPEERREMKRADQCAPARGKDSADSKGPAPNAWKKGLTKAKK